MTPRLHCKSEEYKQIYGSLIGTKYENKCPDFSVDGVFYEYEGFVKPWNKKKVGHMLSHGLQQSSRVVINNTKGCSDRFIRKAVWQEYICQDRKSTRFGFTKKAMSDCSIKTVNSTTTKNNYGEAFADLPAMQRAVAHANFSSKLSQS